MSEGFRPRLVRSLKTSAGALFTALEVVEGEGLRLRAMALTYISLFALVPALVVGFSVVRAFTGTERMTDALHRFLFDNLAVGASETLEPYLVRFIANTHMASAGLVGAFFLIGSSLSLFSNIDHAINETWGVKRRRGLAQQILIYWMGLTLGPLLMAGSLTAATSAQSWLAQSNLRFVAVAGGCLLTCFLLSILYATVPVTRVRALPALVGGLAAGLAWEAAKWGYAAVVGRIFSYHAIYGSVAAVPIFILWLFVSWSIVLSGARLAYVAQHRATLVAGLPRSATRVGREVLAGEALLVVASAFERGEAPPDVDQVAQRLGADAEQVGELLGLLRTSGIVALSAEGGIFPASSLEHISLEDVRRAVFGETLPEARGAVAFSIRSVEEETSSRLEKITFRELCERERTLPLRGNAGAPARTLV